MVAERSPLDSLRRLLADYDRDNRLAIDALYAQFSPTLDDFYAEELRVLFPAPSTDRGAMDELRPDLILTRTVPGMEPKSVRASGATFPLAHARRLVLEALSQSAGPDAARHRAALSRSAAWLWLAHVPRTQLVQLRVEPAGDEIIGLLGQLLT